MAPLLGGDGLGAPTKRLEALGGGFKAYIRDFGRQKHTPCQTIKRFGPVILIQILGVIAPNILGMINIHYGNLKIHRPGFEVCKKHLTLLRTQIQVYPQNVLLRRQLRSWSSHWKLRKLRHGPR